MKFLLLLILVQFVVLIECTQKRNLSTHKSLSRHEITMTKEHKGSRKGARSNSTRSDEKTHFDWNSNGKKTKSHTKYHQSEQNNQQQEEETYHQSGSYFPWQKPNNPFGKRPNNEYTQKPNNGFGQGFQDQNEDNNGMGQQVDDQKPHIDNELNGSTTSIPKKKTPWKRRKCSPFGLKPCKRPNGKKPRPGNDDRMPGKKGPNGGKSTPNGNNQESAEFNNGEDLGKFNPILFCQVSRQEKCKQIQAELCPSSNPNQQLILECLRNLCSDRETKCNMLRKMANQCNHAASSSSLIKEMCG